MSNEPNITQNNPYLDQFISSINHSSYQTVGAKGGSTNRVGSTSIEEQLNANRENGVNSTDRSGRNNPLQTNPDLKNEILDIPSTLFYPLDLAVNRRYHHFIVFNIYQGTSDEVRLKSRIANQVTSGLLAKGGVQFANQTSSGGLFSLAGKDSELDLYNTLIEAGFPPSQANKYSEALFTSKGLQSAGLTSDEQISSIDDLLQGNYTNSEGPDSDLVASLISPSAAGRSIASAAYTVGAFVGESTSQAAGFLSSFLDASNRDNLQAANESARNYNQRGASGRKLFKPKSEQNVLLANRRFNNANVKSKDTICLYMPQKITFGDQLVYSEEEMGISKAILDAATGKRGAASALLEKVGRRGVSDVVGKLAEQANALPGIGGAIQSLGQEANLGAVRAANTRSVSNPRREMMFRDVGIRTHNFTFDFNPNSPQEAEMVLNIIRMLRYHAYPGLQGGGGHFFTFPAEFELSFYTIDSSGVAMINDNLPKMPRLALQSINVDYSAAGDYKTFDDAKPAFIRIELGFQEMEQLTNEHIVHGY